MTSINKLAKKIFPIFLITLSSCYPKLYDYNFQLVGATSSLFFEDESIKVSFVPDPNNIGFTLFNKAKVPLKILWDNAVIVVVDTSNRVIHGDVRKLFDGSAQIPNIVIAGTYFKDIVTVIRESEIAVGTTGVVAYKILPYKDGRNKKIAEKILSMKGKHMKLYLPIEVEGSTVKNYCFDFEITEVKVRRFVSHT